MQTSVELGIQGYYPLKEEEENAASPAAPPWIEFSPVWENADGQKRFQDDGYQIAIIRLLRECYKRYISLVIEFIRKSSKSRANILKGEQKNKVIVVIGKSFFWEEFFLKEWAKRRWSFQIRFHSTRFFKNWSKCNRTISIFKRYPQKVFSRRSKCNFTKRFFSRPLWWKSGQILA